MHFQGYRKFEGLFAKKKDLMIDWKKKGTAIVQKQGQSQYRDHIIKGTQSIDFLYLVFTAQMQFPTPAATNCDSLSPNFGDGKCSGAQRLRPGSLLTH